MRTEMDTQGAPASFRQNGEIAPGLRGLDDPERVSLIRHGKIAGVIARYLKENAGLRPAFVSLSRGMQEARPEAEAGRDALSVTDQNTDVLQRVAMLLVAFDVGQEGAVIAV